MRDAVMAHEFDWRDILDNLDWLFRGADTHQVSVFRFITEAMVEWEQRGEPAKCVIKMHERDLEALRVFVYEELVQVTQFFVDLDSDFPPNEHSPPFVLIEVDNRYEAPKLIVKGESE